MQAPRLDSPWPWLAALAALALLLAARRGPATQAWWSGTLELWRVLARAPRAARGARRRPPVAVACAALALVAGGLALGGARAPAHAAARAWTAWLDASPSVFLPWAPPGQVPAPDAPSRLAVAVERARAALAERGADTAATTWRRTLDGLPEQARGERPPAAWMSAPARPQPAPTWAALDEPGLVWVGDDSAAEVPERALACLSGGAEVPGPVAALGGTRLVGGPAGLSLAPGGSGAARVRLGTALEGTALADVVDAWASVRGVQRVAQGPAELVLEATAPGAPAGAAPELGRIEVALPAQAEPGDDPAAFAADWSERLDRACLPPPGVVGVAERAAAGEPRTLGPGSPPLAEHAPRTDAGPAACALAAALLACAALALGARP